MKIQNLKELQKVIQLCVKYGVHSIEIDGIKMQLTPAKKTLQAPELPDFSNDFPEASMPVPQYTAQEDTNPQSIQTDELTPEQLLMWSTGSEAGTQDQQ